MILRNISYNNKEIKREVNQMIGVPFPLFERFRMRGTGSPRMLVVASSKEIEDLFSVDNRQRYCSIELRPVGIILAFRSRLETYGLIIPYRNLSIFKSGTTLNFYSGRHFVQLDWEKAGRSANSFLTKMLHLKSVVSQAEALPQ